MEASSRVIISGLIGSRKKISPTRFSYNFVNPAYRISGIHCCPSLLPSASRYEKTDQIIGPLFRPPVRFHMSLYYIEAFDDSKAPNEQQTPLRKVRTSIPRTKNENFSHLISMGYQ